MAYGDITVDGLLDDWTESKLLYSDGTGSRLYGKLAGGAFVFAISGLDQARRCGSTPIKMQQQATRSVDPILSPDCITQAT